MPLFHIENQNLDSINQISFNSEKILQTLVERNIETVFNCRFIATEFSTGAEHAGRIDTLALSEDNNPVILEYKNTVSSDLINQSLFYLHWIQDHRGDFEIAVQKALGNDIEVDWGDIRVICIAPNFKKYDLHAVQVMGANIELWTFRLFKNNMIYFEEVFQKSLMTDSIQSDKNPVMVRAGKKAAITRATGSYTYNQHIENKSDKIKSLVESIREYILGLDSAIEEVPKKLYIAYKISQNIACVEVQKQKVLIYLKLKKDEIDKPSKNYKDVTNIGHFGTGDSEFSIKSEEDIEIAKPFIELAYQKVGG